MFARPPALLDHVIARARPAYWISAERATRVAGALPQKATQVNDRAQGNDVAQAVDASRATVAVQAGHGPALVFAGAQYYQTAAAVALAAVAPTKIIVVVCAHDTAAGVNGVIWAFGNAAAVNGSVDVYYTDGTFADAPAIYGKGAGGTPYGRTAALSDVARALALTWDSDTGGNDSQHIYRSDGTDIYVAGGVTNTSTALSAQQITLGQNLGLTAGLRGELYSVVVLVGTGATLPDSVGITICAALARKYATA